MLFTSSQLSAVFGILLRDGRDVVVKARSEPKDRVDSCLQAQAHLASAGFPCPSPLTPPTPVGDLTVHAETLLSGGDLLRGTSHDVAGKYGNAFAWLMTLLEPLQIRPPLPNPYWLRWEHLESGVWPDVPWLAGGDSKNVPDFIVDTATRCARRLHAASLPYVLGHGDFEAQNLRWKNSELWAVHDWDSLAWLPEAALAGAASAVFTSSQAPTLAPVETSEAFLNATKIAADVTSLGRKKRSPGRRASYQSCMTLGKKLFFRGRRSRRRPSFNRQKCVSGGPTHDRSLEVVTLLLEDQGEECLR
jgi:hypothetical protein